MVEETLGIYVGNEWKGEGVKKDGVTKWSRYALKFKPNIQSDKTFTIGAFDPLPFKQSLQINDLKAGTQYKILYNEKDYTNNEGKPAKSKTAAGIYIPSEEDKNKPAQQPTTAPSQTANKPDLSNFDTFKTKYMELVTNAGIKPNPIHMLGSFISSNEGERVKELKAKCIEALQ